MATIQWSDRKGQNSNKRDTRLVTMNGETRSLKGWCEYLGKNYNTVAGRVFQYGWDPIRALTTPLLWKGGRSVGDRRLSTARI